jgi:hypothetical protein
MSVQTKTEHVKNNTYDALSMQVLWNAVCAPGSRISDLLYTLHEYQRDCILTPINLLDITTRRVLHQQMLCSSTSCQILYFHRPVLWTPRRDGHD